MVAQSAGGDRREIASRIARLSKLRFPERAASRLLLFTNGEDRSPARLNTGVSLISRTTSDRMTAQYAEITSIVKELRDLHGTIRGEVNHISGFLVESQPQEGDDEETCPVAAMRYELTLKINTPTIVDEYEINNMQSQRMKNVPTLSQCTRRLLMAIMNIITRTWPQCM